MTWATGDRQTCHGFTLLELMVVLAVMTLAVAALPFALDRAFPRQRLQATAQTLTIHLRELREQSRAQIMPVSLGVFELPRGMTLEAPPVIFYPDGSSNGARLSLVFGGYKRVIEISALTGRVRLGP